MKEGTVDVPHGIGIRVWDTGSILEGFWQDSELHGTGRTIFGSNYYIGQYKEGRYYGQGTIFTSGRQVCTGEWDGLKGQGEIILKDGYSYFGHWDWPKVNGQGTLFSGDGLLVKEGTMEWNLHIAI